MSLSIYDAKIFRNALKIARQKQNLTQAECAELLNHSLSFQKDLERYRCSPSIESYYHICRTLNISADACIFYKNAQDENAVQTLMRLASQCREKDIQLLVLMARSILDTYGGKFSSENADKSENPL